MITSLSLALPSCKDRAKTVCRMEDSNPRPSARQTNPNPPHYRDVMHGRHTSVVSLGRFAVFAPSLLGEVRWEATTWPLYYSTISHNIAFAVFQKLAVSSGHYLLVKVQDSSTWSLTKCQHCKFWIDGQTSPSTNKLR